MDRLLDLVGDRRNVAGLLGAAGGLGLTFGGVIDTGWWAVTAGLYAAGFLAAALMGPGRGLASAAVPVADLPADLRRLARRLGPALPPAARAHLADILAAADSIEPKLREIDPASLSVIAIRQIMSDYIPATLTAYAAIPPRVRATAKLGNGKTADAQIGDQLALLATQLDQAADNLSRGDLAALETQGRFLDEKFKSADFLSTEGG